MKIIARPAFDRDTDKINHRDLAMELERKIIQMQHAKDIMHITGLKKLEGYTHHYRIKVETIKHSFRIGAIVRGDTIWLERLLPRRKIYLMFP